MDNAAVMARLMLREGVLLLNQKKFRLWEASHYLYGTRQADNSAAYNDVIIKRIFHFLRFRKHAALTHQLSMKIRIFLERRPTVQPEEIIQHDQVPYGKRDSCGIFSVFHGV